MYNKVKLRPPVIPENSTIVCTIIIMTILDNIKPMETIRNAESRDTGNFGLKAQNKNKRENKKNPQKPQRKRFKKVEKERPHQDTLGYSNSVFVIECCSCYSFSPVKMLSVRAERNVNMQYIYFKI